MTYFRKRLSLIALSLISLPLFSSTIRFYFENDFPFNDDSDYTNGARLEYQLGSFNLFIEQLMYSPENIRVAEHIPGSHPYAGFLGLGSGYTHISPISQRLSWTNYAELELGMVGPSSLAEETQKGIHKMIGAHDPKGWDNQLHDEFEIQSVIWTGPEWLLAGNPSSWNIRIGDEVGGYLGTMQIAAGNNVNLKIGHGQERSRRPGNIEVRAPRKDPFVVYMLVANETRWWDWNVFLDGNRDGDSYSVDKEVWTTCLKTGIVAEYKHFEFGWFVMFNTKEYKTQAHTPNYMSFQLGYNF